MTRHSKGALARLVTLVLAVIGAGLMPVTTAGTAHAAPGDVGYADFKYGAGLTGDFIDPDKSPTASKPQSKLWFAQGQWWGVLQVPNTTTTTIHSFNESTHQWTNTGVVIDNRAAPTHADVLWDAANGKLFVASAGRDGTSSGIRVSRFRYDTAQRKYVPDGLATGALNSGGVEAAVIAKDTTGRLWVAYTASAAIGRNVRLVVSNGSAVTGSTAFGTPFSPPVEGTAVTADDIATIVAHDGKVSVVWSNQNADLAGHTAVYAAQHPDTAGPLDGWSTSQKIFTGVNAADDHISLSGVEGSASGSVFMVIKEAQDNQPTPDSEGLVRLLVLRPSGVWENYVHSTVGDDMTRPIILLEPSKGLVHVFATSPVAGGVVYRKTTSMASPSFPTGKGEPFIKLAAHSFVNNATSMKQNVTADSGILVLASDQKTGHYVHNYVPGTVPTANFTFTPQTGPAPLAVTFTDTSTKSPSSWAWDFGDGGTSAERNPTHIFATPGTYTVTLTATNVVGSSSPKTVSVTVHPAKPVANFTFNPPTGPSPLEVTFTDTSTGPPSSWAWDFGDGGTSTLQHPTHVFTKGGTYAVKLTASNVSGSSTKTLNVTVNPAKPEAGFTFTPQTGPAPLTVAFTDTSTGPPSSWAWDFGDGGTSTLQHPTHVFAKGGIYAVKLTASNVSGSSTKTLNVTVNPSKPVADFTFTPQTGIAPLAVKFTDTSTGPPSSWTWDFGDGGTSTLQHPTHVFAKAGSYAVKLTASNVSGSSIKTATITVAALPVVTEVPAVPLVVPKVPVVVVDKPATAFATSPYVDAAWHTTTPAGEVDDYDVLVRKISSARGAKWASRLMLDHQDTSLRVPGRGGFTYCLRVRATNVAGVKGAWSKARCTAVPLDDSKMSRSGAWRGVAGEQHYMDRALTTRDHGATLARTVTGKRVALFVTRRPGGGRVLVFEGDRLVKRVSLSSKETRTMQRITIASHKRVTTARYRVVVVSRHRPVIIDGIAVSRR
ncbi:hypothetical protein DDE18_11340 [Nocardioides gansuensis]|uniref:PKD domain-containing protein n=1 Tax=Nocardioides gansuensis TaxID=2138300 RepID=A0A2T8FB43_9ACTN|nr:PKD domain-containing protein [Nocardioides gansuensis]PVG82930.1 hypothetical protein DDE18_11340 [Nocardioides gansuensis]